MIWRILVFLLLVSISQNIYALEGNSGNRDDTIYYSNIFTYENYSNKLANDIRKERYELYDNSFSIINNSFCIYEYPGWFNIDDFFIGAGVRLERNENYSQNVGCELIIGLADIRNPFLSTQIGILSKTQDLVLNNTVRDYFWVNFQFGWLDNTHLIIRLEGISKNDEPPNNGVVEIDVLLGWKSWSPFFLKIYSIFCKNNDAISYQYIGYYHLYDKSFIHCQYVRDNFNISFGITFYDEIIRYKIFSDSNNSIKIDEGTLDEINYTGVGVTFDLKKLTNWLEIFGELHILGNADRSPHVMVISKIGTRMYY